jgi:hypothetical protein
MVYLNFGEADMKRDDLLKREQAAWLELVATADAVPKDQRNVEGPVPGWSTHDLLWHVAFWADYTGNVLERIHGGDPDPKEEDTDEDQIVRTGREMTWDQVIDRAEKGRTRVRAALGAFDAEPPQRAVEWVESDTINHYDEHAAQIRAFPGGG